MPTSIDLHLHSWCSDGLLSPAGEIAAAARARRHMVALTDHDTMAGIPEAAAEAERHGVRFVPGIEMTTVLEGGGEEIHLLAYHLRHDDPAIAALCARTQRALRERLAEVLEVMRTRIGRHVTMEEVEASAPHTRVIDRPHLARVMVARGWAVGSHEVFQRHLGSEGDCFVPLRGIHCGEAIAAVRAAGGIPVLAHPKYFRYPQGATPEDIGPLVEAGLLGLEVFHASHSLDEVGRYRAIAEEFDLLVTGGSDCHGAVLPGGKRGVDHECVPAWVGPQFEKRVRELVNTPSSP